MPTTTTYAAGRRAPVSRRAAMPPPGRSRQHPRPPRDDPPPAPAPARPVPHRSRLLDAAAAATGLGLGAVLALTLSAESWSALRAPGGWTSFGGRLAGMLAAYLMWLMVLLMARIPWLERAAGQDRLTRWHRRIGGWPIVLVALHGVLITYGYAEAGHAGFWSQAVTLVHSYPDVLMAVAAFGLLVMAGAASWRAARRRMRYETWWAIHLYLYLALGLAFAHQIHTGISFIGHPLTQELWTAGWAAAAAAVLLFRLGLPAWRSLRHQLRVVSVSPESNGALSIVLRGRRIDRLRVDGGQFFQWRFLVPGMWWQAHPYSLSAVPVPPYLRITVGVDGDLGPKLLALRPGTLVMIEGPYGTFTAGRQAASRGRRVLLVGAGLGVTPIRAMIEQLPAGTDTHVIVRASRSEDLVLHHELTSLVDARAGKLHEVLGSRKTVRFDQRLLQRLVPDVAQRDVYVCGPEGFADTFIAAARRLGVPEERIHCERFAF